MSEFDQHASTYASAVNDSIAFSGMKVDTFVRAKAFHLRRMFQANGIDPADRIVDVGCGIGTYEIELSDHWSNMVGIDVSERSIAQARLNCAKAEFLGFEGKTMPFASQSVAAVFAICVWHHVPLEDWTLFLSEIRRILRPGGIVAVFEHNPWNPLTRWAVERCVFDKDAVLLSLPTARELLCEAGFSISKCAYILSIPATGGILGRVDGWLAPLPTGAQYMVLARKETE